MIVEYDDEAINDLDGIESYIARAQPRAALRMRQRILDACEGLSDFPSLGRPSPRSPLRELTTVRPYIIIYSVAATVRIRRIIHGARLR